MGWFDFAAEAVPSCEQQNGTVFSCREEMRVGSPPTAKSWGPDSHETHTRPAPSAGNHRAALRRRSSPPTMMVRDVTPVRSGRIIEESAKATSSETRSVRKRVRMGGALNPHDEVPSFLNIKSQVCCWQLL